LLLSRTLELDATNFRPRITRRRLPEQGKVEDAEEPFRRSVTSIWLRPGSMRPWGSCCCTSGTRRGHRDAPPALSRARLRERLARSVKALQATDRTASGRILPNQGQPSAYARPRFRPPLKICLPGSLGARCLFVPSPPLLCNWACAVPRSGRQNKRPPSKHPDIHGGHPSADPWVATAIRAASLPTWTRWRKTRCLRARRRPGSSHLAIGTHDLHRHVSFHNGSRTSRCASQRSLSHFG